MFNHEIKRVFVNPCVTCEHTHPAACPECPNRREEKVEQAPRKAIYHDGKLVIASGEDAHLYM